MRKLILLLLISSPVLLYGNHPDVLQCVPGSPAMFKFLTRNIVTLKDGQTQVFENWCYKQTTVSLKWVGKAEITITMEGKNKKDLFCSDTFLITSILDYQLHTKFFGEKSTYTFKISTDADINYVQANGISLMPVCDKLRNILPDIMETLFIFSDNIFSFLPNWVIDRMKEKNFKRLEKLTGIKSVQRNVKKPIDYNWLVSNVKSGDVYCQYSNGGGSTVILFGTGGVCSHVGMFLWEGDTLYSVESNPPDIHRFVTKTWLKDVQSDPGNLLVLLQLSDENRAKFDVSKAWATYYKYQGRPYGWDNILYSFWDTPQNSFSQLGNSDIMMTYVAILSKNPKSNQAVQLIVEQGLNRRLGTQGLSFEQILDELGNRKMTLGQLGAVPETEEWTYGSDKRSRYICSAFVTKLLIDSGVLKNYNIVPQEQTPNDVYNFKIYKQTGIPLECSLNDPYLPYCQLNGQKALLPFKYYNQIAPYDHVNERCPGIAPEYARPKNC